MTRVELTLSPRVFSVGLALSVLMFACAQPPIPVPAQKPTPAPTVNVPQPVFKPKILGTVTLNFDSDLTAVRPASTTFVTGSNLKFTAKTLQVLDPSTGSDRFINASFDVENLTGAAFNNITLVAYHKSASVNGSAFTNVQSFGGGTITPDVTTLRPTHGSKVSGVNVVVDNAKADLQVFKASEADTLQTDAQAAGLINAGTTTGEGVLQYGYLVTNNSGGRNLPANSTTNTTTIGLRVPQSTDAGPGSTVYRYSMTFLIVQDSITRVTESLEEQAASGAATRASAVSASQVVSLCGSSYAAANRVFVPSARTAGVGTYTAWIGGNFAFSADTISPYSAFGNTRKSIAAASGVLSNVIPLNAATLTAGNGAGVSGSNATVNGDGSFTFDPAAGARTTSSFTYTVSDGTCVSAPQTATANISNMIWYIKNDSAAVGDGRSNTPFKSLSSVTASAANDFLFVYRGTGTTANQASNLTLLSGQQLIGEAEGLTVSSTVLVPAQSTALSAPLLGGSVTLATGNTIKGLDISTSGSGVTGSNFGTFTMSNASVTSSGGATLDLTNGAMNITLKSINSGGGANGLKLTTTTGSFAVTGTGAVSASGGTLQNNTAYGALLSDTGTVTLKNMIVKNIGNTSISGVGVSAATTSGSTAATAVTIMNTQFQNNNLDGVVLDLAGSGTQTFLLDGNSVTNTTTNANAGIGVEVFVSAPNTTTVKGKLLNNTMSFTPASGVGTSAGIIVTSSGSSVTQLQVTSNTISNFDATGIQIQPSGAAKIDATVTNNTISSSSVDSLYGIRARAGNADGQTVNACYNIASNNSAAAIFGYRFEQRSGTTFKLEGVTTTLTTALAVTTFVQSKNPVPALQTVSVRAGTINYSGGTCTVPSF